MSGPAWTPCSVCGGKPQYWAVETAAAYDFERRAAVALAERSSSWAPVNLHHWMENKQPAWATYCDGCYAGSSVDLYGFSVGGWRETMRHVAHVIGTKEKLLGGSDLQSLLYGIAMDSD